VFIESSHSNAVEYLVVGGCRRRAHHGLPRYTGDLDILVRNSPENAQRLESALEDFGFGPLGLKARDFVAPDQVIQLGVPPNRIDLLTSITGVSFAKRPGLERPRSTSREAGLTSSAFESLSRAKKRPTALRIPLTSRRWEGGVSP